MTSALLIGRNRVAALMTSAYLLEEAMSSKDDVSSKLQYIQQSTRSARAGSAMMKSAVMSAISRELQCNQELLPSLHSRPPPLAAPPLPSSLVIVTAVAAIIRSDHTSEDFVISIVDLTGRSFNHSTVEGQFLLWTDRSREPSRQM
ncbi:DNA/RNA-binding protein translin/TB-RBP-like protein [Dorcoceras hygrometricum]|uniref:DNA/RNA-binding protein translin/TB-RBP-like protein n=1 Tax=Dorcoceras hygrometricum TaxID=472368 RepID=A0A2Z7APV3_9LAMI|nr:DNA/RNA-binding protein translin/TB-RBP-like protein [Dorcoceras hygrometricum]